MKADVYATELLNLIIQILEKREKEKEYLDSFYDPLWRSPCWKQLDKLKKMSFPAQDWFENFFSQYT